jgi:hypothetical protein
MDMTELLRTPNRIVGLSRAPLTPGRAGIAFVPCLVCRAPVDLAEVVEEDRPQLCDRHRAADHLAA